MVDVEEGGGETEEEQKHGHAEPIWEGALSEEVGGVGSNSHKLTLKKRKHKDRDGRGENQSPLLCLPAGGRPPTVQSSSSESKLDEACSHFSLSQDPPAPSLGSGPIALIQPCYVDIDDVSIHPRPLRDISDVTTIWL